MTLRKENVRYQRKVYDPDDATEYTVTFRVLNAWDQMQIQNALATGVDDEGEAAMRGAGRAQFLTVVRAVHAWDFKEDGAPLAVTEEVLGTLDVEVFNQLFYYTSYRSEPPEQLDPPTAPSPEPVVEEDPEDDTQQTPPVSNGRGSSRRAREAVGSAS